ncbi:hypothetical protein M408DRAFT_332592 [Serendipita vermifera MAFF 305830]|uniref:CID domain-containing protein n=1 Tax=Serendipita vermifera MAFF 305830 TaxID=933852 RepID=A0A0C3ASL5_SERVB|nr:hypothetical protein M408DRAFT_332592 [Serendipita vermifera MAFF 305830]
MDPFEAHITFVGLLKKLNASQTSIQKVVGFALKYHAKCGEDFWDCIVQECRTGSLNMRINLLYFLDSLCEASALAASNERLKPSSSSATSGPGLFYVHLLQKDLDMIVECAVPESKEGLMNVQSTMQVLENWRTKRIIDPRKVESTIASLQDRKASIQTLATQPTTNGSKRSHEHASRSEAVKRIEEDRERHKLLRERRWVQRIERSDNVQPTLSTFLPNSLPFAFSSKSMPPTPSDAMDTDETPAAGSQAAPSAPKDSEPSQLAIDIEFENAWETTSDWNEDDVEAIFEEYTLCFPGTPPKKPVLL